MALLVPKFGGVLFCQKSFAAISTQKVEVPMATKLEGGGPGGGALGIRT